MLLKDLKEALSFFQFKYEIKVIPCKNNCTNPTPSHRLKDPPISLKTLVKVVAENTSG